MRKPSWISMGRSRRAAWSRSCGRRANRSKRRTTPDWSIATSRAATCSSAASGKRADFVKVLDFGLVKDLAGATQTATYRRAGPAEPRPSWRRNRCAAKTVDARADIYGLGCLAYFLLTGTVVFNKPNAMAMAVAHLTERPDPPSARSELPIPESLERVVMACLEKKREDRPQSVAELRAMLDGCTDVAPWTAADANQWWALHRPEPARKAS